MRAWILTVILGFCVLEKIEGSRPVTNEDIRDAIISIVHMIRSTEDKLERHEYRERLLGDQLKKGLSTIEKRQRLMDPIKGTLGRLDERLAAVETILMQQKEDSHTEKIIKTYDMVEQIHRSLPQLFEALKNDIITSFPKDEPKLDLKLPQLPDNSPSKADLQLLKKEIESKIDNASANAFKTIEMQLSQIRQESQKNIELHRNTSDNLENVKQHINSSEQALEKYETKLAEFNSAIDFLPLRLEAQTKAQVNIFQQLLSQCMKIDTVYTGIQNVTEKLDSLPQFSFIEESMNDTLRSLEDIKQEVGQQSTKTVDLINEMLNDLKNASDENSKNVLTSVDVVGDLTGGLSAHIATGFEQLNAGIADLSKLEKTMVQTSDNIQDTKRRVEYGVHQIVLDVGNLIKEHTRSVNASIKERFDDFETTILDTKSGALANLTDKISGDIDQVWRQIGIMYQQMSANSDTLNKLENQTDEFVNGTSNTMDTMRGKVGQITARMLEVDDNLNYLLGRLSLVTQEFNQIKSGLGQALDDIKSSFQIVQNKIHDENNPGPHQIPSNEIEATLHT